MSILVSSACHNERIILMNSYLSKPYLIAIIDPMASQSFSKP